MWALNWIRFVLAQPFPVCRVGIFPFQNDLRYAISVFVELKKPGWPLRVMA